MNASATKHTAGPWETETGRSVWEISRGWTICTLNHDTFGDEGMLANAQLIAAAPELLSALVDLLDACPASCEDRRLMDAQRAAERVIRKVNGEQ